MSEDLQLLSLPLFPLNTVLFPGGLLPMRIFEVRYLDMIGKCHKTGAPFGVVALTQGHEVRLPDPTGAATDGFATESFHAVGTLASITAYVAPKPGLVLVRCEGTQRFQMLRHEKLKHGLWLADVRALPQDRSISIPDDLKKVARALNNLISTLVQRGLPQDDIPLQAPYQLDDCAWVANRWCELLPLPTETRQRLMALDNPLVRLELVSDLLDHHGIAL